MSPDPMSWRSWPACCAAVTSSVRGGVVVGSGGQKLIGDRDPSGDGRQ